MLEQGDQALSRPKGLSNALSSVHLLVRRAIDLLEGTKILENGDGFSCITGTGLNGSASHL